MIMISSEASSPFRQVSRRGTARPWARTNFRCELPEATPSKPLAKRLAARTGLGAGLISQRLAAHNDDAAIETLLAGGYIPEILALLEPKNKA